MFHKVLVANRGEIACRVIRTCRRLGIKSLAVYSDVDATAPHVRLADEAHSIGPAAPAQSYLAMDKIIAVAKAAGAEAIHPGYGFLSETPRFSQRVAQEGLVFIGPPPEALKAIANKASARRLLSGKGVPFAEWAEIPLGNAEQLRETAKRLGFPIIVKASNAGGGKGTAVVRGEEELAQAAQSAASVARRSFGTAAVHLEKYLEAVRHIEIQALVDQSSNAIHLLERECSWQRRYQKVVEESPSVAVSPLLRRKLAEAALTVMRVAGYVNAGTVEFLVDDENHFYFLEANGRIQVEHPVTEMVTGVDMVELQLGIAAGQRLPLSQDQVQGSGHALEARIYAEDPETFLPSTGLITGYREPSGPGVRVDSGVCKDYEVTSDYDPLVAKLIVWGQTREQATARMIDALQEFRIEGPTTNIPLLIKVFSHPDFASGEFHTGTMTPEFAKAPIGPRAGRGKAGLSEYWRWGR